MKSHHYISSVTGLALALANLAHGSEAPGGTADATPTQLVDALNSVFGKHPGARAVHTKGVVFEGDFTPSRSAATISKAPHLQNAPVSVTVRFSDFAGIPTVPDNDPLANPRGLAIRFHLPDGSNSDIVAHSFNGFPSATAADFRDLLIALGRSGADVAKPTPLDTYLSSHPIAKNFLTAPKPAPVSYATLPYFGVNTFKFTNSNGNVTYGRYQFLPVSGPHYLSEEQAKNASADYLRDELGTRLKQGPAQFKLVVQIAEPADKLDDPSIAWPDTRRTVELGVISISRSVADNDAANKALLFMPNALPDGIAAADPMIAARSGAYVESYGRRHQ
ncbi:MAG TPA: catalase family peroxidase [Steroidobacteraceae bacterium]